MNLCFASENAVVNSTIFSVWWRDSGKLPRVIRIGVIDLDADGWELCRGDDDEPDEWQCAMHLGCIMDP